METKQITTEWKLDQDKNQEEEQKHLELNENEKATYSDLWNKGPGAEPGRPCGCRFSLCEFI